MNKNVLRNVDKELDDLILKFKDQIEEKLGRNVSYPFATSMIAKVFPANIYLNNIIIENKKRKKDRKIKFEIEVPTIWIRKAI